MDFEGAALRKVGRFELGRVAIGSTDVPVSQRSKDAGYTSCGKFGLGGYRLRPVSVQAYVTRDVIERGVNGPYTRSWLRNITPFGGSANGGVEPCRCESTGVSPRQSAASNAARACRMAA